MEKWNLTRLISLRTAVRIRLLQINSFVLCCQCTGGLWFKRIKPMGKGWCLSWGLLGSTKTSEGHDCNNLGFGIFLLLNPKNGVVEINWHVIISANNNRAQTGFQIAYDLTDGTKAYIRKQASGMWSEWRHFNTSEILSNLTTTNKSSLVGAINELNNKTLIITMSGSTDSTGNIRINVPNSFSRMPYVVTNIRDNLQYPYIVIISGWTQNEINFRIRNASDNSAIINTQLPAFQCMLIGK